MCGICGMVGFSDKDLLKKMCDIMEHRGPDDEGTYINAKCKMQNAKCQVGLGVRRLKIIDLETGHQPIHNEDETVWIVFNGEIYNYKDLRIDLEQKGHRFYTKSDTEVIVHLYEEYGEDCVKNLKGMFAFAIWDEKKEKLFLARDRLGIKPLYYFFQDGKLLFASTIKSIFQSSKIGRKVNLKALDYYLTFLYVPAPDTMFRGIKKLLPGHTLTWINGEVTIKEYWDLKCKMQNAKFKMQNEKYYAERIYGILEEAVEERLMSEVSLGAFLSGGIDSSIVVGLMSRIMDQPVKTFSISYGKEAQAYNELKYSRLVAKHFKTDHREFIVEPKVIELLPKLIWHLEEPFADSSAIVTYLVSQVAREHVTVALTGIGGDEAFGGYPRYLGARFAESYLRIPEFLREKVISKIVNGLPESTKGSHLANRLKRFVRFAPLPPEERYISWLSFFNEQARRELYSGAYQDTDTMGIHKSYFEKTGAEDFLNKVFYVDVKTYLPDDLLFMGDRMSMANSLELRVPFCDHRLLEFSATIPQGMKIRGWHMKYLLKKSMSELLPPTILKRGKQGFMVPLGMWFQKELKDFTSRILLGSKTTERGYFNSNYVKRLLEEHYSGRKDNTHQIWALLVFELWYRTFIDREDFSKPPELDELLRD